MIHTPEKISFLKEKEVFVFGSNLKGQHGGGAAALARNWGAVWGVGSGHKGQTYAIPTKYDYQRTLSVEEIRPFVDQFILYAKNNPDVTFLVTKIGCGLAGHTVEAIAPLFESAHSVKNIVLPVEF